MRLLAERYEIIRELGKGSFAVTYLAEDHHKPSHPLCVVKQLHTIHKNNQSVIKLFEKEAIALEKLGKHDQIPTLLAYFPQDDNYYISQEYIPGNDLSTEISHGKRWSEDNVIQLLKEVLEILVFVQEQEVIHRDIKPTNLMRRQPDGKICLIDFGGVKEVGSVILNTQGGSTFAGTLEYMPSEQIKRNPCYASDLYALGMTAIYALTGIDPIKLEEDDYAEKIWRYSNLQVSDYLAEYLTTMIRRKADKRYRSAVEALSELQPLLAPSHPEGTIRFDNAAKIAYSNKVQELLKQGNGKLSVVEKEFLEQERKRLCLSLEDAKEVYENALSPFRDYENRLIKYEDLFIKQVKEQFPWHENIETLLEKNGKSLGLKPEDVIAIETRVLKNRLGIPVVSFEFETAKLIQKPGILGLGKGWEIQRSRKKARLFIEDLGNGVILEMVAIPGGTFIMGSPENEEGRSSAESPQHQVNVPPFFMGKYPVTQKQWQAVAALPKVKIDLKSDPSYFKGDGSTSLTNHLPVECVSWNDAQEFCARLSQLTNKTYRLPSEAEWEYACRAGTTTPFYCGETISTDLANYRGTDFIKIDETVYPGNYGQGQKGEFREKTTAVGIFPANPWGLYDMCGNVWEWCEDEWHENYINAPTDGSALSDGKNKYKVLRGGSWNSDPRDCRSAYRSLNGPGGRRSTCGFRLVVSGARTL
ncbi:SUMF1/EgtB/PvdO family nonheme iron enzyme [Sphaerospermopsis aphanizomenoides BCCUSP55]|uniref:bifunctional serine/threonine-protein kinase/formylglycine-generating enzyme family protein n=1 Tax=Sphaerospermopsis aphanizomenoides TaxID=459663 RepID=UPI00190360FA|nr:bifunctional serine/threonine-protein kinase/formylglycine-generating enzyme family protein [Sphaerospermopsis aphanizomenoides]MBK1990385.1 SUMF1/EgtB/PvdO family nonheme iron enzyme [Sphaerospermopsis aphanizomenoides BCCUSP55]